MAIKDISQEIEETREFMDESKILRLAMFADLVDRFIDIYLKGKASWLKVFSLTMLIRQGGTITPTLLGKRMRRPKDSMTKLINKLVKEGLVKRYRRGKDRRNVQIVITQEGLTYIRETLKLVREDEALINSSIDPEDMKTFTKTARILGQTFSDRIASVVDNNNS
jgi:DNA-binding MarR family transcriptional regulator